jgi:hypothetical protein
MKAMAPVEGLYVCPRVRAYTCTHACMYTYTMYTCIGYASPPSILHKVFRATTCICTHTHTLLAKYTEIFNGFQRVFSPDYHWNPVGAIPIYYFSNRSVCVRVLIDDISARRSPLCTVLDSRQSLFAQPSQDQRIHTRIS